MRHALYWTALATHRIELHTHTPTAEVCMKICNVPGCPTMFTGRGGRCPSHAATARAKRVDNKVYGTSAHQAFRRAVLQRDPICTIDGCHTRSTVADHHPHTRRELVAIGLNPNDPTYGRGLCATHHNTHTAHTSPGGWHAPG